MYTFKKCENGMKYIIHGPFNDGINKIKGFWWCENITQFKYEEKFKFKFFNLNFSYYQK